MFCGNSYIFICICLKYFIRFFSLIKYFVVIKRGSTFDTCIRQIYLLCLCFHGVWGEFCHQLGKEGFFSPWKQECEQLCLNQVKISNIFKNKIQHQRIRRGSESYWKHFIRNGHDTTTFHCSMGIKFQLR